MKRVALLCLALLGSVNRYNKSWYTGETLSVGIGQSYWTVTPLQLTQAITTLVNHGERKVPHFLKATSEEVSIDERRYSRQSTLEEVIYEETSSISIKTRRRHWDLVLECYAQYSSKG